MSTLTEFLRQQNKVGNPQQQAQRRKAWIDALDDLFRQIRTWLAEAEREKLVKVAVDQVKLTEEALGTYTAPCLTLTVGSKTVTLRPIGSIIIGADGRVDMKSPNGVDLFLHFADTKKWVHGFGQHPADFPDLTEELFANLLKRALA